MAGGSGVFDASASLVGLKHQIDSMRGTVGHKKVKTTQELLAELERRKQEQAMGFVTRVPPAGTMSSATSSPVATATATAAAAAAAAAARRHGRDDSPLSMNSGKFSPFFFVFATVDLIACLRTQLENCT